MTTTEVTYYEVVWGDDEADRACYPDYHDGTHVSATAEGRATSAWIKMAATGTRCGLFRSGELIAGERPEPAAYVLDDEPTIVTPVEHKTRTVVFAGQAERYITKSNGSCGRWKYDDASIAKCSCGWQWVAGSRSEARMMARGHRARPTGRPRKPEH